MTVWKEDLEFEFWSTIGPNFWQEVEVVKETHVARSKLPHSVISSSPGDLVPRFAIPALLRNRPDILGHCYTSCAHYSVVNGSRNAYLNAGLQYNSLWLTSSRPSLPFYRTLLSETASPSVARHWIYYKSSGGSRGHLLALLNSLQHSTSRPLQWLCCPSTSHTSSSPRDTFACQGRYHSLLLLQRDRGTYSCPLSCGTTTMQGGYLSDTLHIGSAPPLEGGPPNSRAKRDPCALSWAAKPRHRPRHLPLPNLRHERPLHHILQHDFSGMGHTLTTCTIPPLCNTLDIYDTYAVIS